MHALFPPEEELCWNRIDPRSTSRWPNQRCAVHGLHFFVFLDANSWSSYTGGIMTVCGQQIDHCVQAVVGRVRACCIVRNSIHWGMEDAVLGRRLGRGGSRVSGFWADHVRNSHRSGTASSQPILSARRVKFSRRCVKTSCSSSSTIE